MASTTLCKDLTRLSPKHQTSSLEAFHSVIIHFAPKYVRPFILPRNAVQVNEGVHAEKYTHLLSFSSQVTVGSPSFQ